MEISVVEILRWIHYTEYTITVLILDILHHGKDRMLN